MSRSVRGSPDETVTRASWPAARPPGSVAVTVIVALPWAMAVIVTVEPDTEAPATFALDDDAA